MANKRWMHVVLGVVGAVVIAAMILAALNSCSSGQVKAVTPGSTTPTPNPSRPVSPTTTPALVNPSSTTPTPVPSIPVNPTTVAALVNPSSPVDPTTLTAQTNGDTVSIPLSDVKSKFNTRFAVTTPQGQASYMAYVWNGAIQIRADICPPCGSKSFKLTKGTLVCNSCGTVFDAVNGKGKSGPCIRYSKESVTYQIAGDTIVMKMADLTAAYAKTLAID
jgi:nitrite reductase/ring-hydroxylating ferredoxin subunit